MGVRSCSRTGSASGVARVGCLRRRGQLGTLLSFGQVEDAQKLLGEDEVFRAEDLVRSRVVQVGKHDLDIG